MSETPFSVGITSRHLITAAASTGLISAAFVGTGYVAHAATSETTGAGLVSVYPLGAVTLHNYMAPSSSSVATTQIIETPNELHVIDAQFIQTHGKDVRAYAEAIGKPITRMYLSHWHPDHTLGASQFPDVDFVTTPDVAADCEANIPTYEKRKEAFGDETPLVLPKGSLRTGTQQWDGVEVEIAQLDDCESEHAVTFYIPEAALLIAQDLMFNNVHTFPLGNHPSWIAALENMRVTEGLRLVGCGHGLPAMPAAITDTIAYLRVQSEVLAAQTTAEGAISALTERFPGYEGESALRFVAALYQ